MLRFKVWDNQIMWRSNGAIERKYCIDTEYKYNGNFVMFKSKNYKENIVMFQRKLQI